MVLDADARFFLYLDLTYRHGGRAKRLGVEPVSRDRAFGLIAEWTDVLSGRPEPTNPLTALEPTCAL